MPQVLRIVVLTKPAIPGRVKTRLMSRFTGQQAAAIHKAMSQCVLARLRQYLPGEHVVALAAQVTDHGGDPALGRASEAGVAKGLPPEGWRVMDQGTGDLGERLDYVWRELGTGPVVFFGVDSPDVPREALQAIPGALGRSDAVVGPVTDGGYWTLGARTYAPALLRGIDWGGPSVYHQTHGAARQAGLSFTELPRWYDVDEPADVRALLARLADAAEPALQSLRQQLHAITGN